jgi:hypothetical protein
MQTRRCVSSCVEYVLSVNREGDTGAVQERKKKTVAGELICGNTSKIQVHSQSAIDLVDIIY